MAYQPKSYKKFVATAATATLVATAVVPAAFADEVKPAAFTDVAKQYEAAVNFVVTNNIAKGLTETTFGVSAQIKRGDAAIMIANAAGLNSEDAPASGFSDVPTRGVLAINSLKAAGVVNGKTATNFGFNDSITRGEAAIMLANAFDLTGDTAEVPFTDVNARYLEAVAALVENDVTNGISATQFGTANNIKRGDFARFIYALEEYVPEIGTPAVQTVSATNGTVKATFNTAPETAPTVADFTVTRSINGTTTNVTPSNFAYNATTGEATFTVPEVAQTNAAQTVTYSVQYQETTAKSASFTVAALEAATVASIGAIDAATGNDTAVVIFDAPVDRSVAGNLSNYTYDQNSGAAGPLFNPSAISFNTTAVGPYAAGQVATLTFPAGSINTTDAAPTFRISGFTTEPLTIAESTTNNPTVFAPVVASDSVAPYLNSLVVSAGATTETSVAAGTSVTLTTVAQDATTKPVAVQYRLVNPDGTRTGWSNLSATDGTADENPEEFTGNVNTAGFTPGAYTIEYRTVDSVGNVLTATTFDADTATSGVQAATINITGQDLAAPVVSISDSSATFNLPGNVNDRPGRSLTVTSAVAVDADATVSSAQYRVQSFNSLTGTYTTVTDWTNGSANDGSFNEDSEAFSFTTGSLSPDTTYRVQVRATDSKGNASQPTTVTVGTTAGVGVDFVATGNGTNGYPTTTSEANTFRVPSAATATPTIASALAFNTTASVGDVTAQGTTVNPSSDRDVVLTGDFNAGTGEVISRVELAIYKDADLNGSYETVVQDFSTNGVTANDGAFDESSDAYTVDYTVSSDGNYRFATRATNTAGNTVTSAPLDTVIDSTVPTATITPNTATVGVDNDFVVTFNEAVVTRAAVADGGEISESARDLDNYTLRVNGQIAAVASNVAVNGNAANSFIVTFASVPTPAVGTTVNVVGVTDVAEAEGAGTGNEVAPTSYTIR